MVLYRRIDDSADYVKQSISRRNRESCRVIKMLFTPEKNGDAKPKKPSVLGFMFNPGIGKDVRPMRQAFGMFPRLLAVIFAMHGLFPKQHPAAQGDMNFPLTLGEVLSTAWANLRFDRAGLPKVLLFCAVIGCLIASFLVVITVVLSLFVPAAHAAPAAGTSIFDAPTPDCDLAINFLDYLFLGGDISVDDSCGLIGAAMPNSQIINTALKAALGIYSTAVLIFAGIILLYHLAAMIVETAQTGVAGGKRFNQFWGPIRLVVAIGLLVPVAASGLNSGQYIVIQIAKWGSGFASYVWTGFLDGLGAALDRGELGFVPSTVPVEVGANVEGILKIVGCMEAYNKILDSTISAGNPTFNMGEMEARYSDSDKDGIVYDFSTKNRDAAGRRVLDVFSCGKITIEPFQTFAQEGTMSVQVRALARAYYNAHVAAVATTIERAQLKSGMVYYWLPDTYKSGLTYGGMSVPPQGAVGSASIYQDAVVADIKEIQMGYYDSLRAALSSAVMENSKEIAQALKADLSKLGWAGAGMLFATVTRVQGVVSNGMEGGMPVVAAALGEWGGSEGGAYRQTLGFWFEAGITALSGEHKNFIQTIEQEVNKTVAGFSDEAIARSSVQYTGNQLAGTDLGTKPTNAADVVKNTTPEQAFGIIMSGLIKVLQTAGMANAQDDFKVQFSKTANPLAEIAAMGHVNLKTGMMVSMVGGLAGAGFSWVPFAGGFVGAGGAIAVVVGTALITSGILMAYVLPMLPFIKFFFNILSWILIVFEAVVSAPLFALAHVTPYGEGLPGDMAKKGYFFLLSIFLRPVLLIFGLIAGLLIFFVAINALNAMFNLASAGIGAPMGALAVISKMFFLLMYTVLAYITANTSFKAISFFADNGLQWMSASGPQNAALGDVSTFNAAMSFGSVFMGDKLANAMSDAGKKLGGDAGKKVLELGEK